jgi:hypothetical protein
MCQQQIDAALAARSIQSYRIPYMTEVAEMVKLKAAGVSRRDLAERYEVTHQNVYFIGKKYKDLAACPRGEGSACKAEHAGSNPAAASS